MNKKEIALTTDDQWIEMAKKARENNVTYGNVEKFLGNKEKLSKLFYSLKINSDWYQDLQSSARKIGADVYLIQNLKVNYPVLEGEPLNTKEDSYSSFHAHSDVACAPKIQKNITEETIILFTWKKSGGGYQKTVEWASRHGLSKTTSAVTTALAKYFPKLNKDLGSDLIYVVETSGTGIKGTPGECLMWYEDNKVRLVDDFTRCSFGGSGWYAFKKNY